MVRSQYVHESFTVPDTKKEDKLLFDQLVNYAITYGMGNFSDERHSLFEENFERAAFKEETEIKEFSVICTEEAVSILNEMVDDLLAGTRPLSDEQYKLVRSFITYYNINITHIASKNTCIKLLLDTRDVRLAEFMSLSDVIRLVDELNYSVYKNDNIYKLNLFAYYCSKCFFRSNYLNMQWSCWNSSNYWTKVSHLCSSNKLITAYRYE